MPAVALAGSDVIIIADNVLSDLADGTCVKIEPQGDIGIAKCSKDGNMIYGLNYSGLICHVTVRLVRGSYDDQILNGLLQQFINSPGTFTLMTGSFVKRVGDGSGNVVSEVYQLAGGIFKTLPGAQMDTSGSTEQSVTTYVMIFRTNMRMIQ